MSLPSLLSILSKALTVALNRCELSSPFTFFFKLQILLLTTENDTTLFFQIKTENKQSKVRIPVINSNANISHLAKTVIQQCKYIPEKRLIEVEGVIRQLQCRQNLFSKDEQSALELEENAHKGTRCLTPSIEDIDDYMELIYGEGSDLELDSKIKGTEMIMKLCHKTENLEILIQNRVLMSALSRILSEEFHRSVELTFNISRIFFAFSCFVEMHPTLSSYRVGLSAMNILDLAIGRRKACSDHDSSNNERGNVASCQRHDYVIYVVLQLLINLAEDPAAERKMVKKNLLPLLLQCIKLPSKACAMVSLAFLQKLSVFEENVHFLGDPQTKLTLLLTPLLSHECDEIAAASAGVVFNLSFFSPCRKMLIESKYMFSIVDFLKRARIQTFCQIHAIGILYHLSGEPEAIGQIAETDITTIILELLQKNMTQGIGRVLAALIVNITLSQKIALQILHLNGLTHMLNHVRNHKDQILAKSIRNLSEWTIVLQKELFDIGNDITLPNSTGSFNLFFPEGLESYKKLRFWCDHVKDIVKLCTNCENQDLIVELLGILHNLSVLDLPSASSWHDVITSCMFHSFIEKLLLPGTSPPDILLEAIIFIRVVSSDERASMLFVSNKILEHIHRIWRDLTQDNELQFQIVLLLSQLMLHGNTGASILKTPGMLDQLLKGVGTSCPKLRHAFDE